MAEAVAAAALAAAQAAAGGGQPQLIEALAALLDNRLTPLRADLGTLQGQVNGIQLQQLQVTDGAPCSAFALGEKGQRTALRRNKPFFTSKT